MESLLSSASNSRASLSSSSSSSSFAISGQRLTPKSRALLPFVNGAQQHKVVKAFCAMSTDKEAKLWGGRFQENVTAIVEKFTESISFDKALYKHDIMGSKAHASMLAKQGLISDSDRDSILQGLDEIQRQIEAGEFVWRTDREDVHMNIEASLTDLIGEPAKKLHTARSRNDQVLTDFRLWCRDAIDTIVQSVKRLQFALVTLALKNEALIVPGYTHLQRAQPVLLQHLLLAYVEQVCVDSFRCSEILNNLMGEKDHESDGCLLANHISALWAVDLFEWSVSVNSPRGAISYWRLKVT